MKRGGSNMAYTAQFDLLSPCYKKGEQPAGFHMGGAKAKPTKKGKKTTTKAKKPSTKKGKSSKQRGGSSCGASLSVAEMGVVDKPPASLPKSDSQDAFLERYSTTIMKGGSNGNAVVNVKPNNNKTKALNEIKNKLIPSETISGFALIVKKISENNKNSRNDKYSIEIVSKEKNGTTQIEKLDKTEFDFRDISDNVYKISKKVFPPPEKKPNENNKNKTGTVKPNGNNKSKTVNSNGNAKAKVNNASSLLGINSNKTGAINIFP